MMRSGCVPLSMVTILTIVLLAVGQVSLYRSGKRNLLGSRLGAGVNSHWVAQMIKWAPCCMKLMSCVGGMENVEELQPASHPEDVEIPDPAPLEPRWTT